MPYSERDLEEIGRDPVRLRAYFWHMEQHWRRLARGYRFKSQMQARKVVGETYETGHDLLRQASHMERSADALRDHINADLFVRSTIDPAVCTCKPSPVGQESR